MSIARQVPGQSAFLLAGNLFTLVAGFGFQIYVARTIGAEGLGIFGMLEAGVAFAAGLLGFGLAHGAVRFIPELIATGQTEKIRTLVFGGLRVLGVAGGLAAIGGGLAMTLWPLPDSGVQIHRDLILAGLLLVPLGLINEFQIQTLRGFLDIRYIVIGSSFIQLMSKILITVVVFQFSRDAFGYAVAVVASTATATAWMAMGVRKHLRPLVPAGSWRYPPEWRRFCGTMYSQFLLLFWVLPFYRLVVGITNGPAAVGILVICFTLFALPGIFHQMLLTIVTPMFSAANATSDRERLDALFHLTLDWAVRGALPLILFLMFFAEDVLALFGAEFQAGAWLLRILLVAQFVNLAAGPVGNLLNMTGHEHGVRRITAISTLIGTALFLVLVFPLGALGVGITLLVTMTCTNLLTLQLAATRLQLRWYDPRFLRWAGPAILAVLPALALDWLQMPLPATGLASMLVVTYVVFFASHLLLHGLADDDREVVNMVVGLLRPTNSLPTPPCQVTGINIRARHGCYDCEHAVAAATWKQ